MKDLKRMKFWVCWKYVQQKGRKTKKPYAAAGFPTGASRSHSGEWVTFSDAVEALMEPEKGFDGIGFIMPEGYFLLDVDHKGESDPVVKELSAMFPTYMERSPSGNGFHFYGRCDMGRLPRTWSEEKEKWELDGKYLQKNSTLGLELYIGGMTNRFATFTGDEVAAHFPAATTTPDGVVTDCTDSVLAFLETYMKRNRVEYEPLDTDKYITLTEADIPEIIGALREQKNGQKFSEMFDEGKIPDGWSQSEADGSLCALIAFRAGPNPGLIDAVFRQSALYRPKWEREDYRRATINGGIRQCKGVFHHSLRKRPPFVLHDDRRDRDYVSAQLLAAYVRENLDYRFVRETNRGSRMKYVYRGGRYQIYSDDMFKGAIKQFIADYDEMLIKMSVVEEVFKMVATDVACISQTELNTDENLINFQNGLLDLRSMTLLPHSPSVLSTIQIPCRWLGFGEPTPVFDKYLDTLTSGDAAVIELLLQFMGAALSNICGYRMKKSLFMYGEGNTGKSQLKALTEKLLGSENCIGIDLQQLEARFGASTIYCKRLAGTSDMSYMTVSELKTFKKATGGDTQFAEFKGQDAFGFIYRGLLWFCMNELPKFGGDDGTWVYERIMPVHCPNVIADSKQDHKLLDKMYAEREGIVYKAVTALQTVIANGYRFSEPEGMKESRRNYRVENNTALEFFENCMEERTGPIKKDDKYTVAKIYRCYTDWYRKVYGKSYWKSKKEFFRDIASAAGGAYADMQIRLARGVYLKDYTVSAAAIDEFEFDDFI